MRALLPALALAAGAWLVFAAAAVLALSAAWPLLRGACRRLHPVRRARMALAVAVAPVWVPGLAVALCLAPGVLAALGLHADHCLQHPEHPHLCLLHPSAGPTGGAAGVLALAGLPALVPMAGLVRRARAARRAGARLAAVSRTAPEGDVAWVEAPRPLSFTAGLWSGRIHVSTGLAAALAPHELAVVLAHERAHRRRRDGLRRLLASACSLLLPPRLRRDVLTELEHATEQACDEAAAARVGDRLQVAEVILKVERALAAPGHAAGAPGFAGGCVEARVRHLLDGSAPTRAPGRRGGALAGLALGAGLAATATPLHHATEHLLGMLVGLL